MKAFRVLILTLSVVMVTSLEMRGRKLTHKLKISEIVVQEETP